MKRKLAILMAGMIIASTACSSFAAAAQAAELTTPETAAGTDTITIANEIPMPDYDPVNWYITAQTTLFQNVYSTLVDVIATDDLEIELRPNLASSWETEKDGTVWVFHLNENAVFSSGDPVTADDVKRCFEYHKENPYTMSYVSMIDSIDVRDEHTVAVNLTGAWASVPYCWYMIAIFDPDLYEADKESYIKNPVGSGPYELTSLDETQGTMELTRKEDWWGSEQPVIDTIKVVTITDPSTRIIALQNGEIDYTSVTGSNIMLVEGDENLELKENISIVGWQLLVNPNVEPLNNEKIREAISYAIDYDGIRNATCSGYVSSKDSTIVFSTLDAEIPKDIPVYEYDPEKAKELIAESGLETPVDCGELIGGNDNGSAEMIQQYLEVVGLHTTITQYETQTRVQKMMAGEFGMAITSGVGNPTAGETMLCYYGTGQPYNFNKYSDPEVDELINTMMTTLDPDEYEKALDESLKIVVGDHTNMGLGVAALYGAARKGLYIPPVWNGIDMIRVR